MQHCFLLSRKSRDFWGPRLASQSQIAKIAAISVRVGSSNPRDPRRWTRKIAFTASSTRAILPKTACCSMKRCSAVEAPTNSVTLFFSDFSPKELLVSCYASDKKSERLFITCCFRQPLPTTVNSNRCRQPLAALIPSACHLVTFT